MNLLRFYDKIWLFSPRTCFLPYPVFTVSRDREGKHCD